MKNSSAEIPCCVCWSFICIFWNTVAFKSVFRYLLHNEPLAGVQNASQKRFMIAADHMRYEREGKTKTLHICFACKSTYLVNDFSTAICLHSKYTSYEHWNCKSSTRNWKPLLVFLGVLFPWQLLTLWFKHLSSRMSLSLEEEFLETSDSSVRTMDTADI